MIRRGRVGSYTCHPYVQHLWPEGRLALEFRVGRDITRLNLHQSEQRRRPLPNNNARARPRTDYH